MLTLQSLLLLINFVQENHDHERSREVVIGYLVSVIVAQTQGPQRAPKGPSVTAEGGRDVGRRQGPEGHTLPRELPTTLLKAGDVGRNPKEHGSPVKHRF